jgi:type IV pilus assembly protein PilB
MEAKPRLGDLLVQAGAIDDAQLKSALGEQRQWGRPLGMTLVRMGFIDEDTLIHVLASQLKLPVVKLGGKRVNPEVLDRVPVDLAEKHRCIPLLENEEGGQQVLYLGMEDPADLEALDEISFRVDANVKPVLVAPSQLDEALQRHYHWASTAGDPGVAREDEGGEDGEDEPEFLHASSREELELNAAPPPATAVARPRAKPDGAPPVAILRALSQLLIEKGVITRDELVERLRAVVSEGDGDL